MVVMRFRAELKGSMCRRSYWASVPPTSAPKATAHSSSAHSVRLPVFASSPAPPGVRLQTLLAASTNLRCCHMSFLKVWQPWMEPALSIMSSSRGTCCWRAKNDSLKLQERQETCRVLGPSQRWQCSSGRRPRQGRGARQGAALRPVRSGEGCLPPRPWIRPSRFASACLQPCK